MLFSRSREQKAARASCCFPRASPSHVRIWNTKKQSSRPHGASGRMTNQLLPQRGAAASSPNPNTATMSNHTRQQPAHPTAAVSKQTINNSASNRMKAKTLSSCILLLTVAACQQLASTAAAVAFSVTPSAVSNTYNGTITLQVTGLTNGETVVVQKFLDANTDRKGVV